MRTLILMSWETKAPHDGLQVRLLQAGVQEDKTLVCGIQLPKNYRLWIQGIQVPLPDREEGSLGCIGKSLVYFVVMIRHIICISH